MSETALQFSPQADQKEPEIHRRHYHTMNRQRLRIKLLTWQSERMKRRFTAVATVRVSATNEIVCRIRIKRPDDHRREKSHGVRKKKKKKMRKGTKLRVL